MPWMRILLLHNRYRMSGGEERAVADLQALLQARGNTVATLERSSADLGAVTAARALIGGGSHPEEVAHAVRGMRADVVHAHNLHPLFGWRALEAARHAGARTVLHLHNFRLFCAIGIGYRDAAPCFRCRGTDTWPGARLRCRGSLPEATAYAVGLKRQQPHMFEHTDAVRRGQRCDPAPADRARPTGCPNDGADELHPGLRLRGELVRRQR